MISFKEYLNEKGPGLWANIRKRKASGKRMRKKGEKGAPTAAAMKQASEGAGKYKGETWEDGFKRRVVPTTDPKHKEDGYGWRIKGKEKDNLSIKLYKTKPDFAEYKKQMKRVAGHEFG